MPRCLFFLALASLAACGGLVDESGPGEADGGGLFTDAQLSATQRSTTGLADDAIDAGHDGFFQCVLTPVEGVPCTSTASLCAPPVECGSPSWQCVQGQWEYLSDTPCDVADAGFGDAAFPGCEACTGGVCVVTNTGGELTRHCERTPFACTGVGPTCDCAGSYCGEGCECVGGTSSGALECSCPVP